MKTSFTRDAAVEGKFYFRKDVVTGRIYVEMYMEISHPALCLCLYLFLSHSPAHTLFVSLPPRPPNTPPHSPSPPPMSGCIDVRQATEKVPPVCLIMSVGKELWVPCWASQQVMFYSCLTEGLESVLSSFFVSFSSFFCGEKEEWYFSQVTWTESDVQDRMVLQPGNLDRT